MYLSHRIFKIFVLLTALIFVNACTRAEKEKSAASFSIPVRMTKMLKGDSSTVKRLEYELNYIALNITASGMKDVFCAYDYEMKKSNGSCKFIPLADGSLSVKLELDNGSGRLFQVITANRDYMDPNGSMVFFYADSTVNLSGGDVPVNLALEELNGGAAQGSGHIAGRYITGGTAVAPIGPTGMLELKVKPKADRPAVTIQQTEVYAGWFQAFGLEQTAFEYIIHPRSGSDIKMFGKPMKKSDFISLVTANANLMANVQQGISATASATPIPTASPKPIVPGAVMMISQNNNGGNDYDIVGFFADTINQNNTLLGKVAVQMGNCASVAGKAAFENCISFQDRFRGPFKAVDSNGGFLGFSGAAPSPTTISWAFLPGVDSSVLDGVTVLSAQPNVTVGFDILEGLVLDHGFDCEGYKKVAGIDATEVPLSTTSKLFASGIDPMDMDIHPVAICPRKAGVLYKSAITEPDFDDHGSGGGPQGPYLRVQLIGAQPQMDSYLVAKNGCYMVSVNSYEGYGNMYMAQEPLVFNLNTAWGDFYSNYDCTAPISKPVSLNLDAGYSQTMGNLYIKVTGAASTGNEFEMVGFDNSADGFTFSSNYNLVNIALPMLAFNIPTDVVQNVCYPGELRASLSGGMGYPTAGNGGNQAIYLSVNPSEILMYSNSSDCYGGINSWNNSSMSTNTIGGGGAQFYFKKIVGGTVSINGSDPGAVLAPVSKNLNTGAGSASPARIRITTPSPMELGMCYTIKFESVNASGVVVPAINNMVIDLDPTNFGKYYNDGSCSSAAVSGLSIPPGMTTGFVNFKPTKTTTSFAVNFAGTSIFPPESTPDKVIGYPTSNMGPNQGLYFEIVNVPQFPKVPGSLTYIGSHQLPYVFQYNIPADASISCQTNSGSWGDCGGRLNVATKTFNMTYADITDYTQLKIERNGSFQYIQMYDWFTANGAQLYSCDYTFESPANFDFINTDSAVVAANTICFKGGVYNKGVGTANSILAGDNKRYIGFIDFATGANTAFFLAPAANMAVDVSGITNDVTISNINFNLGLAGTTGIGTTGNPSGTVRSYNNKYESGSANSYTAINLTSTGALSLDSKMDSFFLNASGSGAVGTILNYGSHYFRNSKFVLTSTPTYLAKGISIVSPSTASPISLNMEGVDFSGGGNFLYVEGDTIGSSNFPTIQGSKNKFNNVNTNALGYSAYLKNKLTFTLSDSVISHSSNVASFKFYQDDIDGTQDIALVNSRFINSTDQPAVALFSTVSDSFTGNYHVKENQFVKTTVGNVAKAIDVNINGLSGYAHFDTSGSAYSHGNNLFCGASASFTWSTAFGGNAIAATGSEFVPPSVSNTANISLRVCTH